MFVSINILPKGYGRREDDNMMGSMNRKKAVKAISIGLAVYMALAPIAVCAEELSDAGLSFAEQIDARDEAAANVEQAVEDAIISESQVEFENMEIVASVEASEENTLADTSVLVEEAIDLIENEAIKEATDVIVNVDMSNVDAALDMVTELLDDTLTDETVAAQIEATADSLISIYDAQAEVALNALKDISEEMDAVTVLEDGTVNIDWNAATDEVTRLYASYQAALAAKEEAQTAQNVAMNKKTALSDKINELDAGDINKNKEVTEAISNSKLNKNNDINEIIASVAELHSSDIKKEYTLDQRVSGSSDFYRFYINLVEDGAAYGCLTYYDSANKIILRKNFKISSDNIDFDYVPKDEWVKGNANCKNVVFGNGGNYIAAYVSNTSGYINGYKFDGPKVSNLMRDNVEFNNDIDARNQALIDLGEINLVIEKAEEDLQNASDNANNALKAYKDAVAMYKEVAVLDGEIKNSNIEKAKLEYVKAEIEVWRKQQVLNQIKNTINDSVTDNQTGVESDEAYESIEAVINNIANNLDVEPESVEMMVAQIIIDTENNYADETNNSEDIAVLGARRNIEMVETPETIENVVTTVIEMEVEDAINTLYDTQELVIIEDEEVPLANFNENLGYSINWWLLLIITLACVTVIMYIVSKRNYKRY